MLIHDIVDVITNEVKDEAEKALIKHVNKEVYMRPNSRYYDRTFELKDAIEIRNFRTSGGRASFEIGFNNGRIQTHKVAAGKLNAHTGVKKDFRNGIDGFLDTLENGASGSPIYNSPALGFVDKTYEDLIDNLVLVMGRALSAKGWEVTY